MIDNLYLGSGLNTGVGRCAAGNLGSGGAPHIASNFFAALAVRNFRNLRTFCPGASRSGGSVPSSLPFHLEKMLISTGTSYVRMSTVFMEP